MPKTLRLGAKGGDVTALQNKLKELGGCALCVDGDFGPKTKAAVIAFQQERGLSPDGVVGPKTWAELDEAIAEQQEAAASRAAEEQAAEAEEGEKQPWWKRIFSGAEEPDDWDEEEDEFGFEEPRESTFKVAEQVKGASRSGPVVSIERRVKVKVRATEVGGDALPDRTAIVMTCSDGAVVTKLLEEAQGDWLLFDDVSVGETKVQVKLPPELKWGEATIRRVMNRDLRQDKQRMNYKKVIVDPTPAPKIDLLVRINEVEPLVDGPEIYAEMGKALESAEGYIYLTAWLLHLNVKLGGKSLESWVLEKAKQRCRVRLLWCDLDHRMGSFKSWQDKRQIADWERYHAKKLLDKAKAQGIEKEYLQVVVSQMRSTGFGARMVEKYRDQMGEQGRDLIIGSHHQKSLVVDGYWAFVSGCDIMVGGDKVATYHDCSIRIKGEGVRGVEENFVERWNDERKENEEGGSKTPSKKFKEEDFELPPVGTVSLAEHPKDSSKIKVIRTMPAWAGLFSTTQIRSAYLDLVGDASDYIVLFNQYLRHPGLAEELLEAAKRGVGILIALPRLPEEVKGTKADVQTKLGIYAQYLCLAPLMPFVDSGQVRVLSPAKRNTPYMHTKAIIADDERAVVGSANTNGRSFDGACDSELNVDLTDPKVVKKLLEKLTKRFGLRRGKAAAGCTQWSPGKLVAHDIEHDDKVSRFSEKDIAFARKNFGALMDALGADEEDENWHDGKKGIWIDDEFFPDSNQPASAPGPKDEPARLRDKAVQKIMEYL